MDANEPANETLLQSYGLRGHPSLVILNTDNAVTQTFVGPQSKETLRAAITAVIP